MTPGYSLPHWSLDRAIFLSQLQQCFHCGCGGLWLFYAVSFCLEGIGFSPTSPSLPSCFSSPAPSLGVFGASLCYRTVIGFIFAIQRKQLSGCHVSSELWESRTGLSRREMPLSGWVRRGAWLFLPAFLNWALLKDSQCPWEPRWTSWSLICLNVEVVNPPFINMGFLDGINEIPFCKISFFQSLSNASYGSVLENVLY